MSAELLTVLLAAIGCGVAGLAVPALVRSVPEPVRDPAPEPVPEPDAALGAGPDDRRAPDVAPKEPYADIAALPGLAWKAAVVSAALGAVVAAAVGTTWHLLVLLPLVPIGVALALVDWRTHLLPTRIIAPTYGLVVGLVLLAWLMSGDTDDLVRSAWGWLALGGVYFLLWFVYPPMLGYGDVRLAGVLGIALGNVGWGEVVASFYAAWIIGPLVGLVLRRISPRRGKEYPFGPLMLGGAVVALVVGPWASSLLTF